MGLDTSHGCWTGAYSAFARWRGRLAELAYGAENAAVKAYNDPMGLMMGKYADVCWPTLPSGEHDPLVDLLNHSDCDGEIPWEQCGPLADRLEELLPALAGHGSGGGHIGSYVEKTKTFIEGLRYAAERQENVEFS